MNISLTPELEAFVQEKITTGGFQSPSEVVREALHILREREQKLEKLRREVPIGLDQLDRGESAPHDMQSIKDEVHRRLSLENSEQS